MTRRKIGHCFCGSNVAEAKWSAIKAYTGNEKRSKIFSCWRAISRAKFQETNFVDKSRCRIYYIDISSASRWFGSAHKIQLTLESVKIVPKLCNFFCIREYARLDVFRGSNTNVAVRP